MNIAVFCGSDTGNKLVFQEKARELGMWIAKSQHTLIFGGGNAGLMGIVARAVFENGGKVIGIMPEDIDFIISRPQPYCTEIRMEPDMVARKRKIMEMADGFIALPGGIGTMDEITEIMTLIKIDYYKKPAVLFNILGFYDPFRKMLERIIEDGFMAESDLKRILFTDDINEIGRFLTDAGQTLTADKGID